MAEETVEDRLEERGTMLVSGGGIMPKSCSCLLTLDQSILLRNGVGGGGSTRTVKPIKQLLITAVRTVAV